MNKPTPTIVFGRYGLLVLLTLSSSCTSEPVRPVSSQRARAVRVVEADRSSRAVVTEVVGTVRAVRSTTLAPLISGTVTEIRAGLGSPVRAG